MTIEAFRRVVAPILHGLLFACSTGLSAFAQDSSLPQGTSSLGDIASEVKERFGEVRFHREEELEDRFISHGVQAASLRLLPKFFELQSPRFDFSRGLVIENSSSALPTMYVASSQDGLKAYPLYGFPKAEEEFNRLVAEGPTQKMGSGDAETRGLLCAEVTYGLSSKWWVADPSNAQLQAAEHFFSEGKKDGLLLGEKWWKSLKGDRGALSIQTLKNEQGGFFVRLPVFWAPVEGSVVPEIRIFQIEVSDAGTCHMNKQPVSVLK